MREVALLLVALVLPHLGGSVGERVVCRVERVDLLELELPAVAQRHRLVHLPPLQHLEENAEGRRPGADGNRSARLGERLGDGEAEPAVVGDACDESPLAGEIDG